MEKHRIRPAKESDIPEILALVKELADYEKELEAVEVDEEIYLQDFKAGLFKALVVEQEKKVVAMAMYFTAYSSWKGKMLYLDDLVVQEAYRRTGIGKQLLDALVAVAKQEGAALLKWQVLDWNTPAIRFYEKYEAIIEKEWYNCKYVP